MEGDAGGDSARSSISALLGFPMAPSSLPLEQALQQDWVTVPPIGEGGAQPVPAPTGREPLSFSFRTASPLTSISVNPFTAISVHPPTSTSVHLPAQPRRASILGAELPLSISFRQERVQDDAASSETHPPRAPSPLAAMRGGRQRRASLTGAVLSLHSPEKVSSPGTTLPASAALPAQFSIRGELCHAFISYRANTEGPGGNGLAERIAIRIRSLSVGGVPELKIPRTGWGLWPKSAKRPVPFRQQEAKVYLDRDCLLVLPLHQQSLMPRVVNFARDKP
ncbi:hypothetical protein T484DRAFT_1937432 [Baffinella frigidus]|nr:hypothetical protein T484DRAFT_1937432 [Cryptophyta sp. CCMP2293]